MSSTQDTLVHQIDHLILLVAESESYFAKEKTLGELVSVYTEVVAQLEHLRKRATSLKEMTTVSFVGLSNVGKSTLLNALLGGDVAPRRNGPCTAVPIEFSYGKQVTITPQYSKSLLRKEQYTAQSIEQIHERLADLAVDENRIGIRPHKVEVQIPSKILKRGLIIADTPGFGSAGDEEEANAHDSALKDYLRYDATQVFWVVLAEQGIGKIEHNIYHEFFAEICQDIIVTGAEDWSPTDRMRFKKRYGGLFSMTTRSRSMLPTFHFVSGLRGLEARRKNDRHGLEEAGILALAERIKSLSRQDGKLAAVAKGIFQLASDLRTWLDDYRDERGRKLENWWRPDSFSRWKSLNVNNRLQAKIVTFLDPLQTPKAE